jgi:phage terminase large subunit-like protein
VPLAGRGWGKTRVGAETVKRWAESPAEKIHLIGPTSSAVRSVMVEGPSGLLSCYPPYSRPDYEPTRHRILFPSGAIGETFSADEPERLRGPQCSKYWADEPCAWRFLDEAWDNHLYGFRLGDDTRGICTTTPKPIKWLKDLIADPSTVCTRHSSYENEQNLAQSFFSQIVRKHEGTRLGRQEINAEILEDVPGALWTRGLIEATREALGKVQWHNIIRIVIAIDPAVSHNADSDETGIVVAALTRAGHVLVLDDLSCRESALGWAKIVKAAYLSRKADMICGEVNNGGDLVERNIKALDQALPFRKIWSSRGKHLRAEPVANLYEQGRVHHVGAFPQLEDEMCGWTPQSDEKSPNRLDAVVFAVTELLIDQEQIEIQSSLGGEYQISSI